MFNARFLSLDDQALLRDEFLKLAVDLKGIEIMISKGSFKIIKLSKVKTPAANILKQEMLARGGEVAVPYGSVNCSQDFSDVILMGTLSSFKSLTKKLLEHQFDLPLVGREIEELLFRDFPTFLKIGRTNFEIGKRTYLQGILNVTPDSFSDEGKYASPELALKRALEMVVEGADIIDVGGESTRPGAKAVSEEEELVRVLPVIKAIVKETKVPISIDTRKARVAREALAAGASMVNDVSGLSYDEKMREVVAKSKVPVIIMHSQGTPDIMQENPSYQDVIAEVFKSLNDSIFKACEAGILRENIIIDPGIGFGKRLQDNLLILKRLAEFLSLKCPILIGPSNKSFIGKILGLEVQERFEGTAASVALAIWHKASFVRVHDVARIKRVVDFVDTIVRGG